MLCENAILYQNLSLFTGKISLYMSSISVLFKFRHFCENRGRESCCSQKDVELHISLLQHQLPNFPTLTGQIMWDRGIEYGISRSAS
jgi:hypothetical protein